MGFGDVARDNKKNSSSSSKNKSGSSSSSSSSSSRTKRKGLSVPSGTSPDDFPIHSEAKPYAVLEKTEDGYNFESGAGVTTVEMKATWYGTWEFADSRPSEWKKVWWDRNGIRLTRHIVKSETGIDILNLLEDDPEKANDLIRECSNTYESETNISNVRTCPICGDDLHVVHGDYKNVKNSAVCSDHTVEELAEANFF